jgi:hypothetical protein
MNISGALMKAGDAMATELEELAMNAVAASADLRAGEYLRGLATRWRLACPPTTAPPPTHDRPAALPAEDQAQRVELERLLAFVRAAGFGFRPPFNRHEGGRPDDPRMHW